MRAKTTFVFVHSPLVGVLTWSLVAQNVRQRGYEAVLPVISDRAGSTDPFWKQHADAVHHAVSQLPEHQPITFVAHSGAGPLLPAIHNVISNPVDAYIFVDAGIPRDGASRLDLMKLESQVWEEQFHQELLTGGQYPTWQADDLREVLPDDALRQQMISEIQPRSLSFFAEGIPVPDGWPDAPCAYIKLSETYTFYAEQAKTSGWLVKEFQAGHFHMLVDPFSIADAVIDAVETLTDSA